MYRLNRLRLVLALGSLLQALCFVSVAFAQKVIPVEEVNTPYDEQHAVFSPSGEMFFTVGFHPENTDGPTDFGDVWLSSKNTEGRWTKPIRVGDLSTSGNDVVVGFLDALTILVYHSGGGSMKQGIHQYGRFGSSWNYLRPLEISNFKNNSIYFSGRLSYDGEVILMSMASFGTFGNEDIYVTLRKEDGTWTSPLNLGSTINTFAQEQTPYLSQDNMTIYFSSNMRGDRQGKDIYYAQRNEAGWEDWAEPVRIEGINSPGSETSYTSVVGDPSQAIFSTTQNSEGFGDFMLAQFEKIEPINAIELSPTEGIDEAPLSNLESSLPDTIDQVTSNSAPKPDLSQVPAQENPQEAIESGMAANSNVPAVAEAMPEKKEWVNVRVVDATNDTEIGYQMEVSNERGLKRSVPNQEEWLALSSDAQWKGILITSKGFIPELLTKEDWENMQGKTLGLKPAKAGSAVVLQDIQFNRGTSDFADAKSIQVLDNLVGFMRENPDIKIRLEGHTDNAGDPSLNKDLSMKRASKIRGYLTINGIEFERVRISGWGGSKPVADNSTEEGRERNRRVEMLIEN